MARGGVALSGMTPGGWSPRRGVAAGGDLFTMDMSSGAQSLAGFTGTSGDAELGVVVNRTYVAGAGPSGQAVYRFNFLHDAAQQNAGAGWGGEHYLGWGADVGVAPAQGVTRYTRFRMRMGATNNYNALDSATGAAGETIHKIVIIGDGNPGRTIVQVNGQPDDTFALRGQLGGGSETEVLGLLRNTWYNVQVETVTGSTAISADGSLKLWINNNTYASPSRSATGLVISAAGYDNVAFGYYNNRGIASDGVYSIDLTNFEYATAFDAGWA